MKIITLSNSMDWSKLATLLKVAADGGVQSTFSGPNKYGAFFFVLFGNLNPIYNELKEKRGFTYFKGTLGKRIDKITPDDEAYLKTQNVDMYPLTLAREKAAGNIGQPQEKAQDSQAPVAAETPTSQTPVQQELQKMKAGIDMAMKEPASSRVKELLSFVDRMIERVAQMTDEASQSEFIKNFMQFAAKFHGYSFGNQMLIWVQNPNASYVKGFKAWMELGRQVSNWDKPITIIGPRYAKPRPEDTVGKSPEEIKQMKGKLYFAPLSVYDIADTTPIPDWEKMKGKKPFEPVDWRKDPNEAKEEITAIVNALKDWAKENKISVTAEKMSQEMGGFSAGGKIAINDTFEGINLFSTMVHECAHEILHWVEKEGEKKGRPEGPPESRKDKEIDAETTAYIVLQHYGFETKDTPNYLALWKAKGEDVKKRRENISKAVKTIIEGVEKSMKNIDIEDSAEEPIIADSDCYRMIVSKVQWQQIGKKAGWIK